MYIYKYIVFSFSPFSPVLRAFFINLHNFHSIIFHHLCIRKFYIVSTLTLTLYCIHIFMYTYIYTYIYKYIYMCIYVYSYLYIYIYICTYNPNPNLNCRNDQHAIGNIIYTYICIHICAMCICIYIRLYL
jgi:hypothetical protein